MDSTVLTVKAKYMGPSKKGPAMPGILTMSETRFKWVPADASVSGPLDVEFSVIKAHFFSKGKKALLNLSKGADAKAEGFVFEYDDFKDRDACRDHVAKILGKQNSAGGGVPAAATAGQAAKPNVPMTPGAQSDQFDLAEMERRLKLLQTDSELQKLHSQLVMGQVLSEAEFWSARKHMLDEDPTRGPKQKTGLKTAMLADVRPLTDGRTNKVTFNLTPEIIHQIFTEKPAVHRAFLLNVPTKMSDVDFWTKYCRAEYLYRTKNQAAAAAEAADDEDLAVFTAEDDIIQSEARRKIRKVDPSLDMAADVGDDYTHLPGHGIYRDGTKEDVEYNTGAKVRSIMNDINRHAAVVLEGRPLDGLSGAEDTATVAHALALAQQAQAVSEKAEDAEQKRLERLRSMTVNEDLMGPQEAPHVPLCIQDPRKYFDSQAAGVAGDAGPAAPTSSDPAEALDFFHEQMAAWKKNGLQDSSFMAPAVALKVMTDLTREISGTKFTLGRTAEKNVLDSLPKPVKDDLLQQSAVVHELLRHFWVCYPLTSKILLEKANRLKEAMSQIYTRLQNTKESASAELRHQISQLVQPMFQALDAAFTHYEEDTQRRATKTAQKQAPGQVNGSNVPKLVAV
ncbi:transcription initiation factor TFIIH subunit 1 [Marchantia polymorpha subsp. ruderalis]|uniref:BSD domain-containing protein n=2 Tax=Marchantia polymorpha TaxID=3197 RepID=A0AAF6BZF0_MARPO|nr:hypothetical protein MARPO_0009s0093 [Marchantia polymorpha]PTQ46989.1 hypothetical protein MARPO_0009s0093 [Marchantia polymorpha]BBN17383.1 hypothetical protein Mp_7g14080 [Marchantia polymorpha subsp. ruderalis]BBN17384.1 hypothetical protein Mp_7g14080 [Marchantia polymorpha subsp. ruderalis]|eukprot:PTQ46988.1 hypothetical protein MARPO_0009s0093 [Marchantia polymorpha]